MRLRSTLSCFAFSVLLVAQAAACGPLMLSAVPVGSYHGRVLSRMQRPGLRVLPLEAVTTRRSEHFAAENHVVAVEAAALPVALPRSAPAPKEPRVYIVQRGETLWRIAHNNHASVDRLMALNGIHDAAVVHVGEHLRLPEAEPAPETQSEHGKESAVEHLKQELQKRAQEPGNEPAAESAKESSPEASKDASKESSKEGSRDSGPETGDRPGSAVGPSPTAAAPLSSAPGRLAPSGVDAPASYSSDNRRFHYPMHWPIDGILTSRFGERDGRNHDGIDIGADTGAPIHAAADGTVAFAGPHAGYGNLTLIAHPGGLISVYAHQQNLLVQKGQKVKAGDVIGKVGMTGHTTGPHLHFEVRRGVQPVNPLQFLPP